MTIRPDAADHPQPCWSPSHARSRAPRPCHGEVKVPRGRRGRHLASSVVTTVAALVAVALLVVVAVFQLALALGAPWGAAAWGGQNPGVLPTRLRVASGVAGVVIYPLLIVLVLSAAGWVSIGPLDDLGSLPMWMLAVLLGLGALANFASRSPRERIWGPVAGTVAVCCAILALAGPAAADTTTLALPNGGGVRADYLADGSPVWVIGQDDGTVSVLTGFDAHQTSLRNLLWWCETAEILESPSYGSIYDEQGAKMGGPAPTGLAAYDVTIVGDVIQVSAPNVPPGPDERSERQMPGDGLRCRGLDAPVVYHTFDGWAVWDSPAEALAAEPDDWILLEGALVVDGDFVYLCALDGCADRALATGIAAATDEEIALGHLTGQRFIAQVRDGALVNVTRTIYRLAAPDS